MKDLCTLIGFGVGLVTGTLLYRYSQGTKELVKKGEQAVMKQVDQIQKEVKKAGQKEDKKASK